MRPIVCIRNQPSAPLGIIGDVLRERDIPYTYCDGWSCDAWPNPEDVSALIVLGGEMNVDALEHHPFLRNARDLVRATVDAGRPILGVCLGAQMLARAMGAAVYPAPVKEVGFHDVIATDRAMSDPVLAPFAPRSRVFQFHEDACALPDGAELLFTGDDVAVQAFRVGESAYGVQFHFEVTHAEIEAWCDETPGLEETWGTTKTALLEQADELLDQQQERGREVGKRFLALIA
jgi:GMP synthase-like glutamine amidotransferase